MSKQPPTTALHFGRENKFKLAANLCQGIEDKLKRVQASKHIERKRAIGRRKEEEA